MRTTYNLDELLPENMAPAGSGWGSVHCEGCDTNWMVGSFLGCYPDMVLECSRCEYQFGLNDHIGGNMPAPTYSYVWVIYPKDGEVKVFGKLDMAKDHLSEGGAISLSQVQQSTTTWKFTNGKGKVFRAVKQKILDSTGLAVGT